MTRHSCAEMTGNRAVATAIRASQVAQAEDVEPAMPGLEPRQKLEEAATKWLKKFEFLELERL